MIKLETSVIQTFYQASDGKKFRFENECLIYEAKQRAKQLERFTIRVDGIDRIFYQIDTKEDLMAVCRAFDYTFGTCGKFLEIAEDDDSYYASSEFIGGLIGLGYKESEDYDNDEYFITSPKEFIEEMDSYITKYQNLKAELEDLIK